MEVRAWRGQEQGAGDFLSGGFLGLRRKQNEGRCGEVALGGSCSGCAAGVGFQKPDLVSTEHFQGPTSSCPNSSQPRGLLQKAALGHPAAFPLGWAHSVHLDV